jgi:hypothetical protein
MGQKWTDAGERLQPYPEQIRVDVVVSTCESCPGVVGGMEAVIEAQSRVREYALDYADLLEAEREASNADQLGIQEKADL